MPSRTRLQWNGDAIIARVEQAARAAVNDTVDEARDLAATSHEWRNTPTRFSKDGGQLESEIVAEHADPADPNPTARFGTTEERGFVGLFHEEGTINEFERPFLRPAADETFPTLAAKIKKELG